MRTEPWQSALLIAALTCLTQPLGAQDARLAERLSPALAREVQRVVDSAAQHRLPAGPLVLKALEGASKGADSARILAAVRSLAVTLTRTRGALGPEAEEGELVAGAAALRAGADPALLSQLRRLRRSEPLVVPLSVLADLLTAGIQGERAWTSVRDMASRGASDAAFLRMRDELVGSDRARPLPPAAERPPARPLPATGDRP